MDNINRKCMNCKKNYEHHKKTKLDTDIDHYIPYLGCCCRKCFMKMPRNKRNKLMLQAFMFNNK